MSGAPDAAWRAGHAHGPQWRIVDCMRQACTPLGIGALPVHGATATGFPLAAPCSRCALQRPARPLRDAARAVCEPVDEKPHQSGLNRFDTAAVLWAHSHEATLGTAQGLGVRQAGRPAAVIAADIWGATR